MPKAILINLFFLVTQGTSRFIVILVCCCLCQMQFFLDSCFGLCVERILFRGECMHAHLRSIVYLLGQAVVLIILHTLRGERGLFMKPRQPQRIPCLHANRLHHWYSNVVGDTPCHSVFPQTRCQSPICYWFFNNLKLIQVCLVK